MEHPPTSGNFCGCCKENLALNLFAVPDHRFLGVEDYQISRCKGCGALYLLKNANWSTEIAYPADYSPHTGSARINWIHKLLAPYFFPKVPQHITGKVLEIGSGTGLFLEYLASRHKKGSKVEIRGIEPDDAAVAIARALTRPVSQGDWETLAVPNATIAVLIMNHVIEHFLSGPDAIFEKAHALLEPGGYWVIRTPNAASWGAAYFRDFWLPLDVPRHFTIYTPAAMEQLARRHSFTVDRLTYCGRGYDYVRSAEFRSRAGQATLVDRALTSRAGSVAARALAFGLNWTRLGDSMEIRLRKN